MLPAVGAYGVGGALHRILLDQARLVDAASCCGPMNGARNVSFRAKVRGTRCDVEYFMIHNG